MNKNTLDNIRNKIDEIDIEIEKLIQERAKLAIKVADIKIKEDKNAIFYRPEREVQVISKILKRNKGPLKDKSLGYIFKEIMSACLSLEGPLNIAILGPDGTFTQEAALKVFGHSANTKQCNNIEEVFIQVNKDNAKYGIVPIENSASGIVANTLDLLYSYDLTICGETEIEVSQNLMMADKKRKIKTIYAHRQALLQCNKWLSDNYPNAELKSIGSNALAAKKAKEEKNSAAISSIKAMKIYGLECVAENIENSTNNSTRFIVIGKEKVNPSNNKDKTSLLVVIKHKSGALVDLLECFKKYNINILQLARHPIPNVKWEYIFFLDIEGHQNQKDVKAALEEVKNKSLQFNILGSYPIAVL